MSLASGSSFGPYQILEPLGRGGMATVYKAYEPGLDRYVALKVLPREYLHDETFAERFQREARVVARLEHPNIIPIHNFGIEPKTRTPWMAMRMISGGALSGLMERERLSSERTVAILRGVADALDYAHGKGVVHRDIKPQNVLLDEAGRVYLADFGIAKMLEGPSALTASGMISGTPDYMAPEQALGGTVDARADVYALGVVTYQMLTGRVPFSADTPVAVLMQHVQQPVPIPSTEEVPEPVMRAVLKALAKAPSERWGTSLEFVLALESALGVASLPVSTATDLAPVEQRTADRTSMAPPPLPPERLRSHAALPQAAESQQRAPRSGGTHGMIFALIAGLALAGVPAIGLLVWFLKSRIAETAASVAPAPRVEAKPNLSGPSATLTAEPPQPEPSQTPLVVPPTTLVTLVPPVKRAPAASPVPAAEPAATAPTAATATPDESETAKVSSGFGFYQKTLAYAPNQSLAFDARIGPIRVPTVRFTVSSTKAGWIKLPGRRSEDPKANLRATLPIQCPQGTTGWRYKLVIELLDEGGRGVERLSESGGCKAEAKTITAERDIPRAKEAAIRSARVRLEAEID